MEGQPSCGTLRYETVSSHKHRSTSRRDDLISIGYVLVYFFKGELPWSGLCPGGTIQEKKAAILKLKEDISIEDLTAGMPEEFTTYLNYCTNLKFEEDPDFKYMNNLFEECKKKNNIFGKPTLCWCK